MRSIYFCVAAALSILLTGCATPLGPDEAAVTFSSNPPGATITTAAGTERAPAVARFKLNPGQQTAVSSTVTARWVSGASASARINLKRGNLHYVFQRPQGVPGLEQDVQYAIHLERMDAAAASDVGDSLYEMGKSLGAASVRQGGGAPYTAPSAPQTINCSSYARPSGIETRCR